MNPTFFLHPDDGGGKQEERRDTQQSIGKQNCMFPCFLSWEKKANGLSTTQTRRMQPVRGKYTTSTGFLCQELNP